MMSYKNLTTGFKWTLPTIYYAFPRGKSGDRGNRGTQYLIPGNRGTREIGGHNT